MASGDILKVVATDPGSVKDLEAFCKQTGDSLELSSHVNGQFEFYIKKRA